MCKQIAISKGKTLDARKARRTLRKVIKNNRDCIKQGAELGNYLQGITRFVRRKHVTGCKLF